MLLCMLTIGSCTVLSYNIFDLQAVSLTSSANLFFHQCLLGLMSFLSAHLRCSFSPLSQSISSVRVALDSIASSGGRNFTEIEIMSLFHSLKTCTVYCILCKDILHTHLSQALWNCSKNPLKKYTTALF